MLIPTLTDKKDLKTLILFALSLKENLSAKELYFAIKRKVQAILIRQFARH